MLTAFIVDSFPSLPETYIASQIQGLRAAGHRIIIFAGSRPNLPYSVGSDLLVIFYNEKPASWFWRVCGAWGKLLLLLFRAPRAIFCVFDFLRYGRESLSLNFLYQAAAFSKASGAQAVIAHFGPNGRVAARMKAWGVLRGRLSVFFHAYDLTSYVDRQGPAVYQELFDRADHVLAVSDRGKQRLAALGCPDRKLAVHRMGIDVAAHDFFPRNLDRQKPFKILSVGRLVEKKGLIYGIESLPFLRERGFVAEYVIIGDGALREVLEKRVAQLGLGSRVVFVGARDNAFVQREMRAADIFLLPSVTAASSDEEGIPVVLMEALAAGLPVVAADTGAVNELIVHGQTGLLINEKDPLAIAEAVECLFADPHHVCEMAKAGRRLVESRHNSRVLNKQLESYVSGLDRRTG